MMAPATPPDAAPPDAAPLVALLVRALDGGGMQRNVLRLAGAFAERGLRVDVLAADAGGPMGGAIARVARLHRLGRAGHFLGRLRAARAAGHLGPIPWRLLLGPGPGILAHFPALESYLARQRPRALLAFGTQCNLAALWAEARARSGARIVVSERSQLSSAIAASRTGFRRHYPALIRAGYPRAAAIVAVSDAAADDLAATAGIERDRIVTIPNPVAAVEIAQAAEPLDHPWLAPGAPPVILAVGRLHRVKDFVTLLRAFARLRQERPARLVILGEGPERRGLESLSRQQGVAGDVALPGFVANPFAWMARARVLVLSSRHEGFGNVLVEALACGLPIVASDIPGGPREVLQGGRLGRLVPAGDPSAFADAIAATLDGPPEPALLEARAGDFALPRIAQSYQALLMGA